MTIIEVGEFSLPFDPKTDKLFCSFCGKQCVEIGHITHIFLMCPDHGEFTIAPVVIQKSDGWHIEFESDTLMKMWQTCQHLSKNTGPKKEEQV